MRWTGMVGRALVAGAGATALLLAVPAPAAASATTTDPGALEARLLELVNGDRSAAGLPPLRWDADAAARSRSLAESNRAAGTMSHTSGGQLADWYMPPNESVAELLAHAPADAAAVRDVWMRSDYHRGLLGRPTFELAGFGAALDDDGTVWVVGHLLDPPAPVPAPAAAPAAEEQAPPPAQPPAQPPSAQPAPDAPAPDAPASPAPQLDTTAAAPAAAPALVAGAEDGTAAAPVVAIDTPDPAPLPALVRADGGTTTTDPAEAGASGTPRAASVSMGGFRPGLAAAVSAPTVAVATAVRRRRRRR